MCFDKSNPLVRHVSSCSAGLNSSSLGDRFLDSNILHNYLAEDAPAQVRDGVGQVYIWINMLICGRFQGSMVASPIQSRLFFLLEDAHAAYLETMTVKTTPFPHPFTQIIFVGLFLIAIIVPVLVFLFAKDGPLWWAVFLTCGSTFGFQAL